MDLIEILILVFFIGIPLLEGILKQRRKPGGAGGPGGASGRPEPPREDRAGESPSAADMVPEDLWAILTGERPRRPVPGPRSEPAPWSEEPESVGDPIAVEPEVAAPDEDWRDQWARDEGAEAPEPTSLEYVGPEAYSLETPAPAPRSLEGPIPPAEERHEAFHARLDRRPARKRRGGSSLVRALRHPAGLRQAVLLKEVLGPPRGLE